MTRVFVDTSALYAVLNSTDQQHMVARAAWASLASNRDRLFTSNYVHLSLVDCTSFEIMRQRGIGRVFAYDAHFEQQGFDLVR